MARLYADENVAIGIVQGLLSHGHDVLTALDDGRANQQIPDSDVLDRAIELARCIVTNNRRHFHRLHAANPTHCGIITFTTDPDYGALADRIHGAIVESMPLEGKLVRVVRPNP